MIVVLAKKKNYLAMILNSVRGENNIFKNVYASVDGVEQDIVRNGFLGCAFFASGILLMNGLISSMHTGVAGLERDLNENGWNETKHLQKGAIIVWEQKHGYSDEKLHKHIGFYVGDERAISNDPSATRMPMEHHYTFGTTKEGKPVRNIVKIYQHPVLNE